MKFYRTATIRSTTYIGKLDVEGPIYVLYYVTHPDGQVPVLQNNNVIVNAAGVETQLNDNLSVIRSSAGNRHVYRFTLKNGMVHGASAQFDFSLYDGCVECVYKKEAEEYFRWNIDDDWSHAPMLADEKQVYTVVVLSKDEKVLYGSPDRGAPPI